MEIYDYIIIAAVACAFVFAVVRTVKAAKHGKCIGCPYAEKCGGRECAGKSENKEKTE